MGTPTSWCEPYTLSVVIRLGQQQPIAKSIQTGLTGAGCQDDKAVVEYLVKQHGVCLIPGSSCGAPGYVRVAFGNLQPELCQQAAVRLKHGLQQLVTSGLPA